MAWLSPSWDRTDVSLQDTLTTIQNIFPILLEIPRNRLELSIAIESTIDGSHWSIIRDEAWPGFAHNPPPRMLVRVIDALGDLEASTHAFYPCESH